MKRKFDYTKKESYTQTDIDTLLDQHGTFVEAGFKEYVSAEDHKKISDELKVFTKVKRDTAVSNLILENKLTDENKVKDAIALSGITDDDDDKTILEKVTNTIKDRDYLKVSEEEPSPLLKKTIGKEVVKTVEVDDKFKNV